MKEDRIQVKVSAVQMIPRGGSMLVKNVPQGGSMLLKIGWVNALEKSEAQVGQCF